MHSHAILDVWLLFNGVGFAHHESAKHGFFVCPLSLVRGEQVTAPIV